MVAMALCCGQSAAQTLNQLGARPPGAVKPTESERQAVPPTTAPTAPAAGDRVGVTRSTEPQPEESSVVPAAAKPTQAQFRIERLPMIGGAELLTIFGRLDGMRREGLAAPEVPLVSVVRDTLSDNDPENDRLRYVLMLTYTQPTLLKRFASAIPFLYQHVGNKTQASKGPPVPILNLSNTGRQTWNHFFWMGLQNVFLDSYGIPLKAASRSYRRNAAEYRTAHVTHALDSPACAAAESSACQSIPDCPYTPSQ